MNNACDCPSPPGGRVKCSFDQLAICEVLKDGTVEGRCEDVLTPSPLSATLQWLTQTIIGPRDFERLNLREDQMVGILRAHRFERSDGAIITFRLPDVVIDKLRTLGVNVTNE